MNTDPYSGPYMSAPPEGLGDHARDLWLKLSPLASTPIRFLQKACWPMEAEDFHAGMLELQEKGEVVLKRPWVALPNGPETNAGGNSARRAWRMPEWMRPFEHQIAHPSSQSVEGLLNTLCVDRGLPGAEALLANMANRSEALIAAQAAAFAQVELLKRLHNRGVLLEPERCPTCLSWATVVAHRGAFCSYCVKNREVCRCGKLGVAWRCVNGSECGRIWVADEDGLEFLTEKQLQRLVEGKR